MPTPNISYYLQTVTELLQNPTAPVVLYSNADLTLYINRARIFVAGAAQCIRTYATLAFPAATNTVNFTTITTAGAAAGIGQVLNVRMVNYQVASGFRFVNPRPWEWFFVYELCNPTPTPASYPKTWSQLGQGVAGSISIAPALQSVVTLNLDCVCLPIDLATNTDVEAIPAPWTECVCFLAGFYALMGAQNQKRYADAKMLLDHFNTFMDRCRSMVTPETSPYIYQQSTDPTIPNQLALQKASNNQ